jgi:pyruvate,water dikinase
MTSSPALLPIPAGLPEPWETPEDQRRFWQQDRMHYPGPIAMLEYEMVRRTTEISLNAYFQAYDMPFRASLRRFWAHRYISQVPLDLTDEERADMVRRSEEKSDAAIARLWERWESEFLPEIQQHFAWWEQFDLPGATTPDLLAHLDETLLRWDRIWTIHFDFAGALRSQSRFEDFYNDVFGSDDAFAAYRLLQGFDNLTLRTGRALWELSRQARDLPAVRAILEARPAPAVIPELERSDDGRAFLRQLRAYLDEYGQRGDSWGLSHPSWIEDPTPVIENLQRYITQPERDPDLELARLAAEREQHVAVARETLRTYPAPVRQQFESLLRSAQQGVVLLEDHGFWIDFRTPYRARRVFLELGRRFAEAGVLESPDDVVHLTLAEIEETARHLPSIDRRQLVAERKAEIAHYAAIELPLAVGTRPPGPPPDSPQTRTRAKFFGAPPQPSDDPRALNGAAGSPGVACGIARVVRSLRDAGRVQPGDVLVAEMTAPSWTPLFATVAAVVTDTGGILSHCAVVAREYQIPAVVGAGRATSVIQDGQLIEVDGNRGVVRIIEAD